jgi:hypothetical protein
MKKLSLILISVLILSGLTALGQKTTDYPNPIGNLKFNTSQLSFQNINNTDTKTDTIKVMNDWNKPMTLLFSKLPEYIKCKAVPDKLNPKQKGYILVTYDASKRNDFGYIYDRMPIETNDSAQAEKFVNISVNIVEDFSKMTPEQLANAPKIKFDKTTYEFGTIKEGDKIETDFKFTNEGKSDLIIRKTKGSCGCTVGNPEKSTLKPGESTNLHVTFNSAGKSGPQTKTVTVTTNDPANSSAMITITGKVDKKDEPVKQVETPNK